MILVLDTNVVVSAQVFGGKPRELVAEIVKRGHVLATCAETLAEIEDVFQRRHIVKVIEKAGMPPPSILPYARMAAHFSPVPIPSTVRDPDDDVILGCAVAAHADIIVSGDKDLLDLGEYDGVRILSVSEAFDLILNNP